MPNISGYVSARYSQAFAAVVRIIQTAAKVSKQAVFLSRSLIPLTSRLQFRCGTVVQRKTYSTPIAQGNGGTHLFP